MKPFLQSITLRNILSFGPATPRLDLRGLNVLIGPNGSGKSNFLDILKLMQSCGSPMDWRRAFRTAGGIRQWPWRGNPEGLSLVKIIASCRYGRNTQDFIVKPAAQTSVSLGHELSFDFEGQGVAIASEQLDVLGARNTVKFAAYQFDGRHATIRKGRVPSTTSAKNVDTSASVLAWLRGYQDYPEITALSDLYRQMHFYRSWEFGRESNVRQPQPADGLNIHLEEDFSNLGLVLNRFDRHPAERKALIDDLRALYDDLRDISLQVEGGTVQVFFREGDHNVPATRLSDGSLRYLCLLAILHDPEPPPLIVIDEPELGLHPDLLHKVADRLIAASERTQIIVTTHSETMVSALTDHPDVVIVCEKEDDQTVMRRLRPKELRPWLEKYRLGKLWSMGEIGGNRW